MNVLSVDLHVHTGNERWGKPILAFTQALYARGVRLCGLLDHVELHLMTVDWANSLHEQLQAQNIPHYDPGMEGLRAMYRDIDAADRPAGLRILKGLEFKEIDATPEECLRLPDYVCFCFGEVGELEGDTFGHRAAQRIRQVGRKVRPTGKACIINHPFRNRLWAFRDLLAKGAPPAEQFISADDVKRMVEAAAEFDLALEVNQNDIAGCQDPAQRPALDLCIHAVSLLVQSGADLSLGSDSHAPPAAEYPPAVLEVVEKSGLSEANLRGILGKVMPLAK